MHSDGEVLGAPVLRHEYGMSPAASSLPPLSSPSMGTPSPLLGYLPLTSECRTPETPLLVNGFESDLRDPPLFMEDDGRNPWEGHPYENIFMNMTGSSEL
jgi:hypothetical protein